MSDTELASVLIRCLHHIYVCHYSYVPIKEYLDVNKKLEEDQELRQQIIHLTALEVIMRVEPFRKWTDINPRSGVCDDFMNIFLSDTKRLTEEQGKLLAEIHRIASDACIAGYDLLYIFGSIYSGLPIRKDQREYIDKVLKIDNIDLISKYTAIRLAHPELKGLRNFIKNQSRYGYDGDFGALLCYVGTYLRECDLLSGKIKARGKRQRKSE